VSRTGAGSTKSVAAIVGLDFQIARRDDVLAARVSEIVAHFLFLTAQVCPELTLVPPYAGINVKFIYLTRGYAADSRFLGDQGTCRIVRRRCDSVTSPRVARKLNR
jgi:hypothetical protein